MMKLLYLHAILVTMMRRIYLIVFILSFVYTSNAQIHELGVFFGGSNFVGDVGPTTYIAPNEVAVGLLYKWNKSPRHSWRFSYIGSTITSHDNASDTEMRLERNYAFKNSIREFSLGMEFNFFEFNLHETEKKVTPYIFTGLSAVTFYQLHYEKKKYKTDNYDYTFAIPIVIGVKSNISEHWILGLEAGTRYTFTDNLDGSNTKKEWLNPLKFGNTNSNDWVIFTGFTLTYTFGKKTCYCNY